MKDLKEMLFEQASKALDDFKDLDARLDEQIETVGWGLKPKRDAAYELFCAVWQIIEAAELVDEYQAWKEG